MLSRMMYIESKADRRSQRATRAAAIGALLVAGIIGVCGSGRAAVEQSSRGAMGGDEWLRDIWVMRADGSRPVRVTPRGVPDDEPAWSPDGRLIAYTSWGGKLIWARIWVVSSTGGGRRPITPLTLHQYAFSPTWSPDGKRIAFAAGNYSNDVGALYVINSDGTGLRRLLREPARIEDAAWSPDGRTIAYVRRGEGDLRIILTPVAGGARRVIAREAWAPAWSPDGTRIAVSRSDGNDGVHVFVMEADGSGSRHVGRGDAPSWSPDGKWIAAYESYSYPPSFAYEIGVLPASGGPAQNLTKSRRAEDYNPSWSPDGRHIAFASTRAALRNP